MTRVSGVVLAAGAGRRMGLPKALLRTDEGEALLPRTVRRLVDGGCDEVVVVLGARAEEAHGLLDPQDPGSAPGTVRAVLADGWEHGMAASLSAGLWSVTREDPEPDAVLLHLVDLPDVTADVVARVLAAWREDGARHDALLRAGYGGEPGHPVLLGRDHARALVAEVAAAVEAVASQDATSARDPESPEGRADYGARHYLAGRRVPLVECDDLATGRDVDRPEDLR